MQFVQPSIFKSNACFFLSSYLLIIIIIIINNNDKKDLGQNLPVNQAKLPALCRIQNGLLCQIPGIHLLFNDHVHS